MRRLAIKQLVNLTTPVDRIMLVREFSVDEWLVPALAAVCEAPALISNADIDRIGLELFKKVARARDSLSTMAKQPVGKAVRVVRDVFELAENESEPTPPLVVAPSYKDDWGPVPEPEPVFELAYASVPSGKYPLQKKGMR
jgi:hypothetical protein